MFWCFVLCLVYTTSKYTTTLLLLLLKSISFHCCYFFPFVLFFSFILRVFFIIIIRCYRTFSLAHTHPSWSKWRDDFSFGLFFLLLLLLLFPFSHLYGCSAHTQHHCSQLTIFHSLDTTFFAQVFCIFTLNIEHLSSEHTQHFEHWTKHMFGKFNLHSSFVSSISWHLFSFCPPMSSRLLSSNRFKRFKKFDIDFSFSVEHSIGNSISFSFVSLIFLPSFIGNRKGTKT